MTGNSAGNKGLFYGAIAVSVTFWASGNVAARVAAAYFSPEALALSRFLCAALVIDVVACIKKVRLPRTKDLPLFILMSACGFWLCILLFNFGIRSVSAATASFIWASSPVLTAVMAIFILKEKMRLRGWLATAVSVAGVAVITLGGKKLELDPALVYIIVSVLILNLYHALLRKLTGRYGFLEITTYCINLSLLFLMPFLPRLLHELPGAPLPALLSTLWLGAAVSVLAFPCWAYVLQATDNINRISNFMFLTPALTVLMAYLILEELPPASTYVGGALVLLGVVLMHYHRPDKASGVPAELTAPDIPLAG